MKNDRPPYRFGVIGCGRMGRLHASRLQADGRGVVTALFDADQRVSESLRDALAPQAEVHDRLQTMLTEAELDAVVIATPTTAHYEQILACRQQGLPILCEKPLADSAERIARLIEIVGRGGAPCSLGYQRRGWATYRTLRREVRSGRWGPIRAVNSHNTERWQQTIAGTWRDDPTVNVGGFLADAGSHKIDALFYVTDLTPTEVFARSQSQGSRVEIVTTASIATAEGVMVAMDFVGNAQFQAEDLHVHCAEADLMIRDMRAWIARDNRVQPLEPLEPEAQPITLFLDLLQGIGENLAPIECAASVFACTRAVLQSSHARRPVVVNSLLVE